jgi:hypothetical protein
LSISTLPNFYLAAFAEGYSISCRFGIIEGPDNSRPPLNQWHQGFFSNVVYNPYASAYYVHSMTHLLADTVDVPNPGSIPGLAFWPILSDRRAIW